MRRLANLIDAFQCAEGAPPRRLMPFLRWSLAGSWRWLLVAGGFSALAGVLEVISALMLGRVIDAALDSGLFDRVVVSTDSEEIASRARELGADVPVTAGLGDGRGSWANRRRARMRVTRASASSTPVASRR